MTRGTLLIVDDDPTIAFALESFFTAKDLQVVVARDGASARAALREAPCDLVVIDQGLPDVDGVTLIQDLLQQAPDLGIVMLTGAGSIELAVRAIQEGAKQFLTKPVELSALALLLDRILDERRQARVAAAHRAATAAERAGDDDELCPANRGAAWRAAQVASPALLIGETGVGKGVLARWMHRQGPRANEAMVELNCAGLERELLESELFGHERGAFTGAAVAKPGLFEIAHRGTLFLDEVAELDPVVQAKLLKVIEDQRFRRVGGTHDRQVEVRIITATSRPLPALIEQGRFRADLYYRLSPLVIEVPPLRERKDELGRMVERILRRLSPRVVRQVGDDVLALFATMPWPGNVRELRNVLERAALFCDHDRLAVDDVTPHLGPVLGPTASQPPSAARRTLAEVERDHIVEVLAAAQGRVDVAAEWLSIPRSTLYERLRRYGIARGRGG
jgi:DNA-binding NtrC family response regulator